MPHAVVPLGKTTGRRTVSHRRLVAIETATETVGVAVRTPDGVEAELTLTGAAATSRR